MHMAEKVGFENRKSEFSELFKCKYVHIVHKISFFKNSYCNAVSVDPLVFKAFAVRLQYNG